MGDPLRAKYSSSPGLHRTHAGTLAVVLDAGDQPLLGPPALPRPASARCTTGCLTPVRPTGPQHPSPNPPRCAGQGGNRTWQRAKCDLLSWLPQPQERPHIRSSRSHRALLAQLSRLRPWAGCSSCEVLLFREPTPRALFTSLSFYLFGRAFDWPCLTRPCRPLHDKLKLPVISSHSPKSSSPPTRRPSFVDDPFLSSHILATLHPHVLLKSPAPRCYPTLLLLCNLARILACLFPLDIRSVLGGGVYCASARPVLEPPISLRAETLLIVLCFRSLVSTSSCCGPSP